MFPDGIEPAAYGSSEHLYDLIIINLQRALMLGGQRLWVLIAQHKCAAFPAWPVVLSR